MNVANIVKDVETYTNNDNSGVETKQAVVVALESLTLVLDTDSPDPDEFHARCEGFKDQCSVSLAHRCLAATNDAYPILIRAFEKFRKIPDMLLPVVEMLCGLCDGQPDVLDKNGVRLFLDALQEHGDDIALVTRTVRLVRLTCVMHEQNRQSYVASDLIPALIAALERHRLDVDVVKEVCKALRVLTFDDDIRVLCGKAHQHAIAIVTHAHALQKILNICTGTVFGSMLKFCFLPGKSQNVSFQNLFSAGVPLN